MSIKFKASVYCFVSPECTIYFQGYFLNKMKKISFVMFYLFSMILFWIITWFWGIKVILLIIITNSMFISLELSTGLLLIFLVVFASVLHVCLSTCEVCPQIYILYWPVLNVKKYILLCIIVAQVFLLNSIHLLRNTIECEILLPDD